MSFQKFISQSLVIAVLIYCLGSATSVSAMPMFARKYGVNGATCHTLPPRLNETGYKFRVVAAYQQRETARGAAPTQAVNAFQMRLIFIK
ncbi:MAG: hypothetical protein ACKVZH_23110 [Blastocatellia bacterium]